MRDNSAARGRTNTGGDSRKAWEARDLGRGEGEKVGKGARDLGANVQ